MKSQNLMKTLMVVGLAGVALAAGAAKADGKMFEPSFKRGPAIEQVRYDRDTDRYGRPGRYASQAELKSEVAQRLDRQMDRILDGLENGRLTNREAVSLLQEQRQLERLEKRYLADDFLSLNEFRELDQRLDVASQRIFAEKRDRQFDR
jgi:hypothetical protein